MKPQYVLALARKAYPGNNWRVSPDGRILSPGMEEGELAEFNINNPRDLQAVQMALRNEGWKFREGKRGGKPWFFATHNERGDLDAESWGQLYRMIVA